MAVQRQFFKAIDIYQPQNKMHIFISISASSDCFRPLMSFAKKVESR